MVRKYGFACGVSQCHELRGDLFNAIDHGLSGRDCASKEALSCDWCTETHVRGSDKVDGMQIDEGDGYS